MRAARTFIPDLESDSGGIVVDAPAFEVVRIERPFLGGATIEIPLHLVPGVLTALMKAARVAAIDLAPEHAAGYAEARSHQLANGGAA
jgi:hypothetical protein